MNGVVGSLFDSGIFTGPTMGNTWAAASLVAVIAGSVGFFVVLRGEAFAAHALPRGGFAGAAGASLLGLNVIFGLLVFTGLGALLIGWLGNRARHDVATALTLVLMLGTGALFLSWSQEYEPEVYSLLFGEVLGVSASELTLIAILALICLASVLLLYRPLLYTSVVPEIARARGTRPRLMDLAFLLLIGLAASITVPVVGALLCFSLTIGPAAAARTLSRGPFGGLLLAVGLALVTVWAAIVASYLTGWPIGFFVGAVAAIGYAGARTWARISARAVASRGGPGTRRQRTSASSAP